MKASTMSALVVMVAELAGGMAGTGRRDAQQLARLSEDGDGPCAFSPDGTYLVTTSLRKSNVALWRVASLGEVRMWAVPPLGSPGTVALSSRGDRLAVAVAGPRPGIHVYSGTTGRLVRSLPGRPTSVAISPDGSSLAIAGPDGRIAVCDLGTGNRTPLLARGASRVVAMAFSPDSRHLVTAGEDQPVRLWLHHTGRLLRGRRIAGRSSMRGERSIAVYAVAFARKGSNAVLWCEDGSIRHWSTATGSLRTVDLPDVKVGVPGALSADGSRLVRWFSRPDSVPRQSMPDSIVVVSDTLTGKALYSTGQDLSLLSGASVSPDAAVVAILASAAEPGFPNWGPGTLVWWPH